MRRIIGLSLLNSVGVTALNHLTVLQFAFPDFVLQNDFKTALARAYSYSLTLSYAPRSDYLADIAALSLFDLTVGQYDEFFIAETFRPVLESATDAGAYHMVQGRGHLDVLFATETLQITIRHLEAGSL